MKLPKNIRPLAGSVLIAIILWLIVATEKEYLYQIEVPINLIRIAEGKTLTEKIPDKAIIEFKGRGRSLVATMFYSVAFNLELPELNKSQSVDMKEYLHFLDLPATFGVETGEIIEPQSIDFRIDDLAVMKKPIVLTGEVTTENGYILEEQILDPDSVEISGPRQKLEKIGAILTEPLSISGVKASFNQNILLQNPFPGISEIRTPGTLAEFNIQRLIERVVYDIPIQVINTPAHLQVEAVPDRMSLKISGGEDIVAFIKSSDIKAEIDYAKNYKMHIESYGASIVAPPNIRWIESIPKSFKLKVRRRNR